MDHFMLPVDHEGKELEFDTRLVRQGYVYKFIVSIWGRDFSFELDEEGDLRAILETDVFTTLSKQERSILEAVSMQLRKLID